MRKVEGVDYLYQRGDLYLVRMQVPVALQRSVGRADLKKSLGPDFAVARRKSHGVIFEFSARLNEHAGQVR